MHGIIKLFTIPGIPDNQLPPALSANRYNLINNHTIVFHVSEVLSAGQSIGFPLTNLFTNKLQPMLHFLTISSNGGAFGINKRSGQVFLRKSSLDYETKTTHTLYIEVRMKQHFDWSLVLHVTIMCDDVIDEPPVFSKSFYTAELSHDNLRGTKVVQLNVADSDQRDWNRISITSVLPPKGDRLFAIEQVTQSVYLSRTLTSADVGDYELVVTAVDSEGLKSEALVLVRVEEQMPLSSIDQHTISLNIDENSVPNEPVACIKQTFISTCDISYGTFIEYFDFDENSMCLKVVQELDHEAVQFVNITIACQDNDQLVLLYHYDITINNLNDNAPMFPQTELKFELPENLQPGLTKLLIHADDSDAGSYGRVVAYYFESHENYTFTINYDPMSDSHYITNSYVLDFEVQSTYSLTVLAEDSGGLVTATPLHVEITVVDQNEHRLEFTNNSYSRSIISDYHGHLFQFQAKDAEMSSKPPHYSFYMPYIHMEEFVLDSYSGELSLVSPLTVNHLPFYAGYVIAWDEDGLPSPPAHFKINVIGGGLDHYVVAQSDKLHRFKIPENIVEGTRTAMLACEECAVYTMVSPGVPFRVNSTTGEVFTSDSLDYELDPTQYNFTVLAIAYTQQQYRFQFTADLLDVNEHVPHFTSPSPSTGHLINISSNLPQGTELLVLYTEDDDSGPVYGTISQFKIIDPLFHSETLTLPFEIEQGSSQHQAILKTTTFLNADLLAWLKHIDIVAIDGGGYISDPFRVYFNFDQHNLKQASQPKSRYTRQAPDITNTSSVEQSIQILLSSQNFSALFDEFSSKSQPFNVFLPENSNAGALEVMLEVVSADLYQEELNSTTCNKQILFLLEEINVPFRIVLDNNTCMYTVVNTKALDFESENESRIYPLTIQAVYNGIAIPYKAYLRVYLQDVNDHSPVFSQAFYSVNFPENFVGTVLQSQVDDLDGSIVNTEVSFNLTGDDRFEIDNKGTVRCLIAFDYEISEPCFYFNITATDSGGLVGIAQVKACLEDENDNCPQFPRGEYDITVEENTPTGTAILNVTAVDRDASFQHSSTITYSIQPSSIAEFFQYDASSGQLEIEKQFDFESDPTFYSFQLVATDASGNTCSANISVTLLNQNDLAPAFTGTYSLVEVPEEMFPFQVEGLPENVLICVTAVDPEGDNITYFLPTPSEYFEMSSMHEGCLVLKQFLDFESVSRHLVEILVTDGLLVAEESLVLIVDVRNLVDLSIKVEPEYEISVPENFYTQFSILNITVKNPSRGIRYLFEIEQVSEFFHVTFGGRVHLTAALDYEQRARHVLTVSLTDGADLILITVTINVIPVNEHPPTFLQSVQVERGIRENTPPYGFEYLFEVVDDDRDSVQTVSYEVEYAVIDGVVPINGTVNGSRVNLPFSINQTQSKLFNHLTVDYERDPTIYDLKIYATDGVFRSNPLSLRIVVLDENDHAPVFPQESYEFAVTEDEDDFEIDISAHDGDGSLLYNLVSSYSIEPIFPLDQALPFFSSGSKIRNTRRFNFEFPPILYIFLFVAEDDYGQSGSTNITIHIGDANEFRPLFDLGLYKAELPENSEIGTEVVRVRATDRDRGPVFGEVTYSMQTSTVPLNELPFSINETSGVVYLTSPVDFDAGQEGGEFFVVATDGGGYTALTRVFISIQDINDNPPCPDPRLQVRRFRIALGENIFRVNLLLRVQVFELDYYADNPRPIFYLEPSYDVFRIDGAGRLYISRPLDHEEQTAYNFSVIASDGIQNCSNHTTVEVIVLNVDDNRPQFLSSSYEHTILETTEPQVLFNVSAYDADPPDTIQEYRLRSQDFTNELPFAISNTGQVSNTIRFNADDPTQPLFYIFEALAYNQFGQGTNRPAQIFINIVDVNDHAPIFVQNEYNIPLLENHPVGTDPFVQVRAIDDDRTSEFNTVSYRLDLDSSSAGIASIFFVSVQSGHIYLISDLDFETVSELNYTFRVIASDGTIEGTTNVNVNLQDVNEFAPVFPNTSYHIVIPLDVSLGSSIYSFEAIDFDKSEQYGSIEEYTLVRDGTSIRGMFPFQLDLNGTLYSVINATDYQENQYTLKIVATDQGNVSSSPVNVTVSFEDSNLHGLQSGHCIQLLENYLPQSPILDLALFESRGSGLYEYVLLDEENFMLPLMLQGTEIILTDDLDFETQKHLLAAVLATNRLGDEAAISVSLCAQNINDNPTNFIDTHQTLVLNDDSGVGPQLELLLSDLDSSWRFREPGEPTCCTPNDYIYTDVNFTISGQSVPFTFEFNKTSGVAMLISTIPVSEMTSCTYNFHVETIDTSGLPSDTPLEMEVMLRRRPQGNPVFSQLSYDFSLLENSQDQFTVSAMHIEELNACLDPSLASLEYVIASSSPVPFTIEQNGVISNSQPLDYETSQEIYTFNITATNEAGSVASVTVTIQLIDVNEFCPEFHLGSVELQLSEVLSVGDIVYEDLAYDGDGSVLYGDIHYTRSNPPQSYIPFNVHPNGSIYLSELLDYESGRNNISFQIEATDGSVDASNILGLRCTRSLAIFRITVEDENDEIPFFQRTLYSISIREDTQPNSVIARVEFSDPDGVGNEFTFELDDRELPLRINSNGEVILTREVNYETPMERSYRFAATLSDGIHSALSAANITVNVINVNEFSPTFDQEYSTILRENEIPAEGVLKVSAIDQDAGQFGEIARFEITGSQSGLFEISSDGVIKNRQAFDFEIDPQEYNIMAVAYDGGGRNSSTLVRLRIQDVNDNQPVFEVDHYSKSVSESTTPERIDILTVHAMDDDLSPRYNEITYSILQGQICSPHFDVDTQLGILSIVRPVDFEIGPTECELLVVASDPRNLRGNTTVHIQFLDSNEYNPVIPSENGMVNVSAHEALEVGDIAFQFEATDLDGGPVYGSIVDYRLVPVSGPVPFNISNSGELIVTQSLTRFTLYTFEIVAIDGGGLESERVPVNVHVAQANFFTPEIITTPQALTVEIEENALLARPLWSLDATDGDGNTVEFQVVLGEAGLLRIQPDPVVPNRAAVWQSEQFDFEMFQEHQFEIAAFDGFYSSIPVLLTIQVLPVNEHAPAFPETFLYVEIAENQPAFSYQIEISAFDADQDIENVTPHGIVLRFSIVAGSSLFTIVDQTADGKAILTNTEVLDYEFLFEELNVTIQATDGGGLSAIQPLVVQFEVLDSNDNYPQFYSGRRISDSYSADITENIGGIVLRTFAIDYDSSFLYSQIFYSLQFDTLTNFPFEVDHEGVVYLTHPLNYELDPTVYMFTVTAEDIEGKNSTATVTVNVLDVNEYPPVFESASITIEVSESTRPFSVVYTFNATDEDGGENFGSVSHYRADGLSDRFIFDVVTGELILNARGLDFESNVNLFNFEVTAFDFGGLSTMLNVTLVVKDVNEFPPQFQPQTYSVSILENTLPSVQSGFPINVLLQVSVTDQDGTSITPMFTLQGSNLFSIDSAGYLILATPLDYEEASTYELLVHATDGELTSLSPAVISVTVLNVNDNPPVFTEMEYTSCVVENVIPPMPVVYLIAKDDDGDLEPLVYTIEEGSSSFSISPEGELRVAIPLDFEAVQYVKMIVSVRDGSFASSLNATVNIYMIGTNDILPVFNSVAHELNISEATPPDTAIQFGSPLFAIDGDLPNLHINKCVPTYISPTVLENEVLMPFEHQPLTYWTLETNTPFAIAIDNTTNFPYLKQLESLDYETNRHEYTLTVVASDGNFESQTHARVHIHLVNEDDSAPMFEQTPYEWIVYENLEVFSATVTAFDPDRLGDVSYSIASPAQEISIEIDPSNGTIYSLGPFDFELRPNPIHFAIAAEDVGGHITTVNATLHIFDINDHSPVFEQDSYNFTIPESSKVGDVVFSTPATDEDGSALFNTVARYVVIDNQGQLNPLPFSARDDGAFILTRPLDFEAGPRQYVFQLMAIDSGNRSSSIVKVSVTITDVADTAPCPTELTYTTTIPENQVPFEPLFVIEIDLVEYNSSLLVYTFSLERDDIEVRSDGNLYLVQPLDFENETEIVFNFTVSNDILTCESPSLVRIVVTNENDNPPEFVSTRFEGSITEHLPTIDVLYLHSTDRDGDLFNPVLRYEILTAGVPFRVTGGYVQNTAPLDAEVATLYTFEVVAIDSVQQRSQVATVVVRVEDLNEFVPEFEVVDFELRVQEGLAFGTLVFTINAIDADAGEIYGSVEYEFANPEDVPFAISPTNGSIYVNGTVDFETTNEYSLLVNAVDGGGLRSTARVHVILEDVNEFPPQFDAMSYTVNITEGTRLETEVYSFQQSVLDQDGSIEFSTIASYTILTSSDPLSLPVAITEDGVLVAANFVLDYESGPRQYAFQLQVHDGNGLYSEPVNVTLVVLNANDLRVSLPRAISLILQEDTQLFSIVAELSEYVTDPEEGMFELEYFFLRNATDFVLSTQTGTLMLIEPLNNQIQPTYTLYLVVFDNVQYSNVATITITVVDRNFAPVFPTTTYNAIIVENAPSGSLRLVIPAEDDDAFGIVNQDEIPDIGRIVSHHFVLAPIENNPFDLTTDSETGAAILTNNRALDYEQECVYRLTIVAVDGGGLETEEPAQVTIMVEDVNEFGAEFTSVSYTFELPENTILNEELSVIDEDRQDSQCGNTSVDFSLRFPHDVPTGSIVITPTGYLQTSSVLDYEVDARTYSFEVILQDGPYSDTVPVSVNLLDQNEFSPVFNQSSYFTTVEENITISSVLLTVHATDEDGSEIYNTISEYRIISSDQDPLPFILNGDGTIELVAPLDYEGSYQRYRFSVTAIDGGGRQTASPAGVTVQVQNVNDLAPTFSEMDYHFSVTEVHYENSLLFIRLFVGTINAQDQDRDPQPLVYFIHETTPFIINSQGIIYMNEPPDFEGVREFHFTVSASDGVHLTPQRANVTITIQNINEHSPMLAGYLTATLPENTLRTTGWLTLNATDLDMGLYGLLSYSLISGNQAFKVDDNGHITNVREFDYEAGDRVFVLVAEVEDQGGLKASATVNITVRDVNEFVPKFELDTYNASLAENTLETVLSVRARDGDGSSLYGGISYSLKESSTLFDIHSDTGEISLMTAINYENYIELYFEDIAEFVVLAVDGGGLTDEVTVFVRITDVNEYSPMFPESSYSHCISESTPVGVTVLNLKASDNDGGQVYGEISSYSLVRTSSQLSIPFEINNDGQLVILQSLSGLAGLTYEFDIIATDGGGLSSQPVSVSMCVLERNDNPPRFIQHSYETTVTESNVPDEPIVMLKAVDDDNNGTNLGITFLLFSHLELFEVSLGGGVQLKVPLDFEKHGELLLEIGAFDGLFYSMQNATVLVSVYPVNEHKPQFPNTSYEAFIMENAPPGSLQLEVSATDQDNNPPPSIVQDLGLHGEVTSIQFTLTPPNSFEISFDQESGTAVITNVRPFDVENGDQEFVLAIVAEDGSSLLSDPVEVVITVLDVNDEQPVFQEALYQFTVPENFQGELGRVQASDADISSSHNQVTYEIIESTPLSITIRQNGVLELLLPVDFENDLTQVLLTVLASDGRGMNSSVQVNVVVSDQNEFAPKFIDVPSSVDVPENTPLLAIVTNVQGVDLDGGSFGRIEPPTFSPEVSFLEFLGDGTLRISGSIDYESIDEPRFNITIELCDIGGMCSSHALEINVLDMNEHPPVIHPLEYFITIEENSLPRAVSGFPNNALVKLNATDDDAFEATSVFEYTILSATSNVFEVDNNGFVILLAPLDFEQQPFPHVITVKVSDGEFDSTEPAVITVDVINVNDNPPNLRLAPVPIQIVENIVLNFPVSFLFADDPDGQLSPVTLHFGNGSELSGYAYNDTFSLTSDGTLSLLKPLDYETVQVLNLSVVASDGELLSDPGTVTVEVIGTNDNAPEFSQSVVSGTLYENLPPNSLQLIVKAEDADLSHPFDAFPVGQVVGYEIVSLDDSTQPFSVSVNASTGEGIITNDIIFDFERIRRFYRFDVKASDVEGLSSSTPLQVEIRILDSNDFTPVFAQTNYSAIFV